MKRGAMKKLTSQFQSHATCLSESCRQTICPWIYRQLDCIKLRGGFGFIYVLRTISYIAKCQQ